MCIQNDGSRYEERCICSAVPDRSMLPGIEVII